MYTEYTSIESDHGAPRRARSRHIRHNGGPQRFKVDRTHSYTQSHTARVRATSVADRNAAQLASRARVSVRARAGSLSLGPNRAGDVLHARVKPSASLSDK